MDTAAPTGQAQTDEMNKWDLRHLGHIPRWAEAAGTRNQKSGWHAKFSADPI